MELYLNELAPWERKKEYLHHIQLGKDVKSQTVILQDAMNKQMNVQLASASAIIESQGRITEGLGELSIGIDRVEQGLEGLQATFEWGVSEVVWQIEQNREELKSILEVLMAPLDTQAKERRKRAENAYSNGWMDDAEEEFLEAEKLNRYDFAIHISLGMIYLFHKIDKSKSIVYFEKAFKYALPESKYYASYALLYKALIQRDIGEIKKARESAHTAVKISPDLVEAQYHLAQYNALLNNSLDAISILKKIINQDVLYYIKAKNDNCFELIKDKLDKMFSVLNDELKSLIGNKLQSKINKIENTPNQYNAMVSRHYSKLKNELNFEKFVKEMCNKNIDIDVINKRFDKLPAINIVKNNIKNTLSFIQKGAYIDNYLYHLSSPQRSLGMDLFYIQVIQTLGFVYRKTGDGTFYYIRSLQQKYMDLSFPLNLFHKKK
jgi:tetratricopeptide (TPR) repeat protein